MDVSCYQVFPCALFPKNEKWVVLSRTGCGNMNFVELIAQILRLYGSANQFWGIFNSLNLRVLYPFFTGCRHKSDVDNLAQGQGISGDPAPCYHFEFGMVASILL